MTSRPLVANTRPRGQAAELSALLHSAGFAVLEAPAIRVRPVAALAELPPLRSYAWVVLQSQNAARYFTPATGGFHSARVLCGTATARALGLVDAETLDPFSAGAALAWLRTRITPDDRVLVPMAAEGRDELVIGLRDLGIEFDAPICYRTEPAPPDELQALAAADAITLCSPSAAEAVIAALGERLPRIPLICLGATTAAAVEARGLRAAAIADQTSMPSLVDAVRKTLDDARTEATV